MVMRIYVMAVAIFFASCANISMLNKNQNKSKDFESTGVDLGTVDFPKTEETTEEIPRIKTESTVDILDGRVYVEQKDLRESEEHKQQSKKFKIALILGPGLSRTVGHISVLRNFDRNGIKVDFISGSEIGAIIGAMYASGMTPEMIEWNFYKYFREKSNAKVLSAKWFEELDEFFLKRFQNVRVESLKKNFYLPLYSKKAKKIVYFNKGNLRNLLLLNLKNISLSGKAEYTQASEFEVFNARFAKGLGAELVIGVDAIGNKIILNESNEYIFGFYNRIAGNIKKNRRLVDLYYPLPLEASSLDSDEDAGANLQNALDYSEKIIGDLQKRREAKIKTNSEECVNGCL